jgi:hypothetical protein
MLAVDSTPRMAWLACGGRSRYAPSGRRSAGQGCWPERQSHEVQPSPGCDWQSGSFDDCFPVVGIRRKKKRTQRELKSSSEVFELFKQPPKKLKRSRSKPANRAVGALTADQMANVRECIDSTKGMLPKRFVPGYAPDRTRMNGSGGANASRTPRPAHAFPWANPVVKGAG